jgi:PTS system nitrogen regulatory IIA component
MQLKEMISTAGVDARIKAPTKEQLLKELSRRASPIVNLDEAIIYRALLDREDLGSTGVGNGIALPHARLPGLKQSVGMLFTLERPIDFLSIDEKPVDLIGILFLPKDFKADANVALSCLARRLREPGVADRLRASKSGDEIYGNLCGDAPKAS